MRAAQGEPAPVVLVELAVTWRAGEGMIQARAHERRRLARIRHRPLPREAAELLGAPLLHRFREPAIEERREELERRRLAVLLAHEEQRDRRRREHQTRGELDGLERGDRAEPVALGAV